VSILPSQHLGSSSHSSLIRFFSLTRSSEQRVIVNVIGSALQKTATGNQQRENPHQQNISHPKCDCH
jgi:hypothetical protein